MNITNAIDALTLDENQRNNLIALNTLTGRFLDSIPESYEAPTHVNRILQNIIATDSSNGTLQTWINIYDDIKQSISLLNETGVTSHNHRCQLIIQKALLESALFVAKIKSLNIMVEARSQESR